MDLGVRGKMTERRRRLLVACEGDREHVRRVETRLAEVSAARRALLRKRRQRSGATRPDYLKAVS
jgi:hypothetical protein